MSTRDRFGWMDALRGATILLVIFGHAVQLAGMYSGHDFTRMSAISEAVQPLRMPLLFFLSGMLVPRSLAKGAHRYFTGKAKKILYPYVLWSMILIAASAAFAISLTWWSVPAVWDIVVSPIQHLWFLAYLLVFYTVAHVTRQINPLWVVLAATFAMTVPFEGAWSRIAVMAVPFFLGVAVFRYREIFERLTDRTMVCAALLAAAVLVSVGAQFWELRMPGLSWTVPIMLAFFVGIIGTVKPFGDRTVFAPLRYIGRRSLPIYLVHWPVMMFLVPALVTEGFRDPWALFWVSLASGLLVSIAVTFAAERLRTLQWLFEWKPATRTRKATPAPA